MCTASMKSVFILAFVTYASSQTAGDEWLKWKVTYGKSYTRWEDFARKAVWDKAQRQVAEHNRNFRIGLVSYRLEANAFADLGYSELRSKFTRSYSYPLSVNEVEEFPLERLPRNVDWRKRNGSCVSPVRYQGGPGSCFAFAAIGALEGQYCKKVGKMIPLSVQQILECEAGTCGGYFNGIYDYIMKQKGIMSNADYPYSTCRDCMQCLVSDPKKTFIPMINRFLCDSRCKFNIRKRKTRVKSFIRVYPTEDELKRAVATVGPIAAGIDARPDLALYGRHNDIYYNPSCSSTSLNHAVLVVGYGTTKDGEDYWLVKNSWGEDWGAKGYMRLSRNRGNNCGIATAAMYPVI